MKVLLLLTSVTLTGALLQCYTGYSILRGSSVGTETKECEKDTDYCYNASATVGDPVHLQKAGCNTYICQFRGNACFEQEFSGKTVTFCCCNDYDKCNGGNNTQEWSFLEKSINVIKNVVGKK